MSKKKDHLPKTDKVLKELLKINGDKHFAKITIKPKSEMHDEFNIALSDAGHDHLAIDKLEMGMHGSICEQYAPIIKDGKVIGYKCVKWA